MELLRSGGPVLIGIILLSLFAVYRFVERLLYLLKEPNNTDKLMMDVNTAIDNRDLEGALAICEEHEGAVSRVLEYALSRLPFGRASVEAAFEEAALVEEQQLSKGLRSLATVAQVSPLLGLLGTVTGMMIAFREIAQQSSGNPVGIAQGISQALVTTAAGLMVAIPVLLAYNYLSSRADGVLRDIDRRREELLGRVSQVVAQQRNDKKNAPRVEQPNPNYKNSEYAAPNYSEAGYSNANKEG